MINDTNVIIDFYQRYDEDNRMNRNPLEYLRCKEIIGRYLSSGKMDIVDIGGATGTFSFWLANLGHGVNLVDIVPKHIETATRRQQELGIRLHSALVCDARQLPYESGSFDLALMMGPLYHLLDRKDRIQSIQEAYRVLKPNGIILCEVISRYANLFEGFQCSLIDDERFIGILDEGLLSGYHLKTHQHSIY
jgi:ubiquinone/menaquinone biosynthesis C-methylase UbiE